MIYQFLLYIYLFYKKRLAYWFELKIFHYILIINWFEIYWTLWFEKKLLSYAKVSKPIQMSIVKKVDDEWKIIYFEITYMISCFREMTYV